MKQVTIWRRDILERTGFINHPYKEVTQFIVTYGKNLEFKNGHREKLDNPRLKVKFQKRFETRKKKAVENLAQSLGRSDADKWLRERLQCLLGLESARSGEDLKQ